MHSQQDGVIPTLDEVKQQCILEFQQLKLEQQREYCGVEGY
jgi:hypothetical protein